MQDDTRRGQGLGAPVQVHVTVTVSKKRDVSRNDYVGLQKDILLIANFKAKYKTNNTTASRQY